MKILFVMLLVFASATSCDAQECWSLDQGWIPCSMSDTLTDSLTGSYYVVVRSERCVKAFDQNHNILWETDPWQNKGLSRMLGPGLNQYHNPDSIFIQTIDFPKTRYMGGDHAIVVYFSERIVGILLRKTGEFKIMGSN